MSWSKNSANMERYSAERALRRRSRLIDQCQKAKLRTENDWEENFVASLENLLVEKMFTGLSRRQSEILERISTRSIVEFKEEGSFEEPKQLWVPTPAKTTWLDVARKFFTTLVLLGVGYLVLKGV